jgi:RNA polymerase sigma factor (TIGR02999 family)
MDTEKGEVTRLLKAMAHGDPQAADSLLPLVYAELHRLAKAYMRRERPDHTLQPTALVHEAFLRLAGAASLSAQDRTHFLRTASQAMRRVLVDHARARNAQKRGGALHVTLDEAIAGRTEPPIDMLALDDALDRLGAAEPRWAQVVELRYFAGLEIPEVAAALGVSPATVKRDWQFARAWLSRELGPDAAAAPDA